MTPDTCPETTPERLPVSPASSAETPEWLQLVLRQAASLRFGAIQITVHEGRVTQVEATEKVRFARS